MFFSFIFDPMDWLSAGYQTVAGHLIFPQAAQAHYAWVRASEVIWSEYTRIITVLYDAK